MIVNKWNGILTQGASKISLSINDIIKKISGNYNIVHRLDKDTSGLLIISKNYKSTRVFAKLFKDRLIEKTYFAVCHGEPRNSESIINLKMNYQNKETETVTKYKVIKKFNKYSLILFKPLTGKMHQLRKVSKYLTCPIVGDTKYNNSIDRKEGLMLNACYLKFFYNNHQYEFNSVLPKQMINYMKKKHLTIPNNSKIISLSKSF